jgi:hypothetical protein
MKTLMIIFVLLISLVFTSCIKENKQADRTVIRANNTIFIFKTTDGFNIYSNKGELLLEYNKRNCDSLSLRTLDDIYSTIKEFQNKERF